MCMYNGVVSDERPGQSTRDEVTLATWTSSYCRLPTLGNYTALIRSFVSLVLTFNCTSTLLVSTSTIVLVVQRYRYVPHIISVTVEIQYTLVLQYSVLQYMRDERIGE